MSTDLTPAAREQKRQQAQALHEAATLAQACGASQECVLELSELADKISPNEGE